MKDFFICFRFREKQEYENWELIQFHATIVFVVLRLFLSEAPEICFFFAIHIFSFPLLLFFWVNGWNEYFFRLFGVELICCAIKEMQFTWIILPECSRCQSLNVVQAWRIIPIFLALRWKFSAHWSLWTCAVCFMIARRALFAIFVLASISLLLHVSAIISIFLVARLMFGWRRIVVIVDGCVVVFCRCTRKRKFDENLVVHGR